MTSVYNEIKKHDKFLKKRVNSLYWETCEVDPKYQGKGLFRKIILKLINISKERKFDYISLHARITNYTVDKIIKILASKAIKINFR